MAKTKISEFSTTAGNNTDINSINIAEGCAPSGINDAIRELMRQLKEFQTGGAGDSVNSGGDFSVATNKFTVASASGNTAVAGTLGVTGAATLSSTLAVTGTTTLTGALVANGNATLGDGSGDTVTVKGTPTLEVNPTLSGGTANGVLYLNGSKVATSGSALTFDGATLVQKGAVNTPSVIKLFNNNQSTSGFWIGQGWSSGTDNTGYLLNTASSGEIVFGANNAEQMRLTSTGLGIGTSSPSQKLDVIGSGRFAGASPSVIAEANNGTQATLRLTQAGVGNWLKYFRVSDNAFVEQFGGTDLLALTTSGNLGLGVTPSAWNSVYRSMQLGKGASISGRSDENTWNELLSNAYRNAGGGWTYLNTDYALAYRMAAGTHAWYTAASGTAGNAITFTQAMTLDASGRLGLGSTSPDVLLTVASGLSWIAGAFGGTGGTDRVVVGNLSSTATVGGHNALLTSWAPFAISGSPLLFQISGSERARIDSSGNLLVGTTSVTNSPAEGVQLANGSSIGGVFVGHVSGTATGNYYATFSYNAGIIGSITQSGTTGVLYNITSDQRLKENIVDAPEFGSVIDSIKVRSYDWKADGNHQRAGFVAQELVTVAPEAVHQPADPEEMMAVDYSKLVPMLVKEIQSLRKRLADAGIA